MWHRHWPGASPACRALAAIGRALGSGASGQPSGSTSRAQPEARRLANTCPCSLHLKYEQERADRHLAGLPGGCHPSRVLRGRRAVLREGPVSRGSGHTSAGKVARPWPTAWTRYACDPPSWSLGPPEGTSVPALELGDQHGRPSPNPSPGPGPVVIHAPAQSLALRPPWAQCLPPTPPLALSL